MSQIQRFYSKESILEQAATELDEVPVNVNDLLHEHTLVMDWVRRAYEALPKNVWGSACKNLADEAKENGWV
jgi:hypothetical protein